MKKNIFMLAGAAILASCAASIKPVRLDYKSYTTPSVGTSQKKEIGETLIVKGEEESQEGYILKSVPKITMTMLNYPHSEGSVLPLSGETSEYYLFYDSNNHSQGNMNYTAGVARSKKNPERVTPFINSSNGFIVKQVKGFEAESTTYRNPSCQKCFKKEFIYNGKSGNTLKFIYREYVNDLARPAFSQDLQYDLADGNIIGFKGLRLEVYKATNTLIEYKIEKDFD